MYDGKMYTGNSETWKYDEQITDNMTRNKMNHQKKSNNLMTIKKVINNTIKEIYNWTDRQIQLKLNL